MKFTTAKSLIALLLCLSVCLLSSCIALGPTLEDLEEYSRMHASSGGDGGESSDEAASDSDSSDSDVSASGDKTMTVHFIDVGQGDSAFIELPNGECMLIDAGERDYAGRVISFIDCLGYTKIDHVVATHPHSDHIGGMQRVIESFDIGTIYMPEAITDTSSFINLLEAIDAKGKTITPVDDTLVVNFGGAKGRFVAPSVISENLNDCSAILHLSYGERAFLFTGDAEAIEESTVSADIEADVLKVGHHGSYTSSSDAFLSKVKAQIAVISCGKDNEYGHPHDVALKRLENSGVKRIYRTDISGTVTVITDGRTLGVSEGTQVTDYVWVLNIGSKKVHTASCDSAVEMNEYNKAYSIRDLDELLALGYKLCGSCKPNEE
ncbi:MAG: MBL fold metallo-hydrolase [Clostridia bacterium]|nr:MBL fold metallo-hydrolase [Clostridia bacterium]